MASTRSRVFTVSATLSAGAVLLLLARRGRRQKVISQATELWGAVTIRRTNLGVPHVIAGSRDDALFGLGYAMAEDRLWQMDLLRRKASGRLSEVAGPTELESDKLMRLFGLRDAAERSVAACSPAAHDAMEALSAGVNHYMRTNPLSNVFRLTGYRPEPWTPADSISIFLLMGWALGGSTFRVDLFAERSRQVIGDEWTDALLAGRMVDAPPSVQEQSAHFGAPPRPDRIFPGSGFSNSWAVSGERSVTGKPLLAFDPHLEYTNPSIWCEAVLEAPGFHVAGMTLPGVPGIGAGRTPTVAWGETAGMIGQSFVYREELNDTEDAVRDGDEWVPLRVVEESIPVRGGESVVLRLRYTPRGPLVSDVVPELCDGAVSLYWTGMEVTTEPDLLLGLNMAETVADVVEARNYAGVPVYNASVADAEGNIAQIVVGKIPIREPRAGLLDPSEFPPRYIPVEEMPLEVNPTRGWVAGANGRLVGDDYPYPMFGIWEPPFRMRRIAQVLESRSKHSLADMRALQLDRLSLHAKEMTPVILELLDGHTLEWVLDDLRGWDFDTNAESRPTALFQVFYSRWIRVSLLHRFPDDYITSGLLSSGEASVPRDFCDRLLHGDFPAWFDNQDETRRVLARLAMDEALDWLRVHLGEDHAEWQWGAVNRLTFVHPFGAMPGPQSRLVNVGSFGVGGDRTTVWPVAWRSGEGFDVGGGPSMRLVVDVRRPELIWATNTLGQHGTPWKRHYRDQVDDFLNGRLHQLWPRGERRRDSVVFYPAPDDD